MKSLFLITPLAVLAKQKKSCTPAPEVMWLQDGSGSLSAVRDNLIQNISKLFIDLKAEYNTVRFGTAIWADKPIPFRGFGGRWDNPDMDHCYTKYANLTDDASIVSEALEDGNYMCGGDFPENPYEAILGGATDPDLGWSPIEDNSQGQKPFRVLAFATDDVPHYPGQAQSGLDYFNQPRYPKPEQNATYQGGYGHPSLIHKTTALEVPSEVSSATYPEMCDLWYKNDTTELNDTESARLDYLWNLWGPPSFPNVKPHPYTFDAVMNCEKYEYPGLEGVGEKVNEINATILAFLRAPNVASYDSQNTCIERGYPIKTRTPEEILDCMIALYKSDFEQMKVNAVIKVFESVDDIKDALEVALRNAPEYGCPTEPPKPFDSTTISTKKTRTTVLSTTNGRGGRTTTAGGSTTTGGSGGGSAGTIAGASGGAVAGLAALGGMAYKKFGAFTKGPSANPTIETNEEVPDTPMERESMEEVTMDMFQ